tara:strand:- start:1838 stop:3385 length:1548 start_codon:yes stop_codon:yes gene_type:complete
LKTDLKKFQQILLFAPLLTYFGKRSLIAYDEGFYTLQAKWIIENNNWIAPLWWGNISLDRTIGIQYCLAISQKLFGENNIGYIFPITLAGIIMIIGTYQLHKELVGDDFAIISPLILSTTFLWINYVNMATQDLIYASIITIGLLSSIKSVKSDSNFYFLFSGLWIGLAVMMKTYLTILPLIGIFPFLLNSKTFKKKFYWLGVLIGFTPFIIWSINIINIYDFERFLGLHRKLIFLSKNNNFTNPFYYYLWNIPINIFPWSLCAIIGIIKSKNLKDKYANYFLFKYPLIIIILLSIFSTKTPYYPLQILSLVSINSYLGIITIFTENKKILIYIKKLLFLFIPIIIFIISLLLLTNNISIDIANYQKQIISFGLICFSISWFIINFSKSVRQKILLITLGSYLLTLFVVQSGLITDKSKELRLAGEELVQKEFLIDKKIEVVKNELGDQRSVSKIIKIFLLMPKVGNGIESIENLSQNQYAWTTTNKNKILSNKKYLLINDSEIFSPWKLIQRVD